jgi:FAD:protein FMN transferase
VALRRVEEVMGMPVTVVVADADPPAAALEEVFADFRLLDQTFSPFLPGSAVSRINRGELRIEDAEPLVLRVSELCRLYEIATAGYFSAWADGHFDPSGLVKGWALDRATSILDGRGCRSVFVDAGGDVQTRGDNGSAGPWKVGVRHPVQRDSVVCVLLARDLAVATSGTYEKGGHIVDPHTRAPATRWLSFTVVGPDIMTADVYATACFAMGDAGLEFIARQPKYEALAIDPSLGGRWTAGFQALCSSPPA